MHVMVQKYSGACLADIPGVRAVADLVARTHHAGWATAVVVSTQGDSIDRLLEVAAQVGTVWSARELDQLYATQGATSAAVLALALNGVGVPAVALSGPQAGVLASGAHGAGVITAVYPDRVAHLLARGEVVVVAGAQGLNPDGDIVTFGPGGSETTAVALAAALGADGCEIYRELTEGECHGAQRLIGAPGPAAPAVPSWWVPRERVAAERIPPGWAPVHPAARPLRHGRAGRA